MPEKKQDGQPGERTEPELPPGVKLLRTLKGHQQLIRSIAFNATGDVLASASFDGTAKLWDTAGGRVLRTLTGHHGWVRSVAFNSTGDLLASGGSDNTVRLWEAASGRPLRKLEGHTAGVLGVAFDPTNRMLASAGDDGSVRLWAVESGRLLHILSGHMGVVQSVAFDHTGQLLASAGHDGTLRLWSTRSDSLLRTMKGHSNHVISVAFQPNGGALVSGSRDSTLKVWDAGSGRLLRTLEGHTKDVVRVAFSADGRLLASRSADDTTHVWDCRTWETVAVIPEPNSDGHFAMGLAFHPTLPLMATVGSVPRAQHLSRCTLIRLWELERGVLLGAAGAHRAVHHTTAKIVLVGDSGVGKTGLGWVLAHGEYKEHSSTHGQQFWVLDQLGTRREDGTECEAILWDLAGQPDYRLTHALFLDDADLALVLFDPTDSRDPLHGVEFWLKQLKSGRKKPGEPEGGCPTILVGARADRGEARLTQEELDEFCRQRGIAGGYLATSAKEEKGLDELLRRMREQIPWEQKTTTVTTGTFKRVKDYVLGLKERRGTEPLVVSPEALRGRLEATDEEWEFSDAEMMTAVGHLENYGYVRVLRTSKGEERVLLAPELLNNLAASFVLEARRNPRGLGSLEEKRLLAGEYPFREIDNLSVEERDILLDSATLLFLEHNVCFRETDPLGGQSYLVFPELINLKKPILEDEQPTEDGVAYTVSGTVGNVYASLVVLLGYTQTFTRTDQWRSQAHYEVGEKLICGFRLDGEQDGELDLVLYFGTNVGPPVRTLFQGLFESFLARRNLSVYRYEPVVCANGHALNRAVVRERLRKGSTSAFCPVCGDTLALPKADEPIQLTQVEHRRVEEQQWFAARRTRFEQAVFRVKSYVKRQRMKPPVCFISYAWGDPEDERWVERSLATDLEKAGITVVLDRWENARVGASMSRFVARIEECDRIIVVGTPLYRKKYQNKDKSMGYVVAAEVDLISDRLLDTEGQKQTVLPVLLKGEKRSSLPPLLYDRVFADFRNDRAYFLTAFDLILSLYDIAPHERAVADLRESLDGPDLRS